MAETRTITSTDELLARLIVLIAEAHGIKGYEYDISTCVLKTPETKQEKEMRETAEKEIADAKKLAEEKAKERHGEKTEAVKAAEKAAKKDK